MIRTDTHTISDSISQFAECVFEPNDIVEIRLLPSGHSTWHIADELCQEAGRLLESNAQRNDIYVGANPRKRLGGKTAADVALARCIFADFDCTTSERALQTIESAGLPVPTVAINSGHGAHCYWKLDEPLYDFGVWSSIQKDLAAVLHSDPAINDPPRLMRLPGFANFHRPPIANCLMVDADPSRVYELAELLKRIPEHKSEPKRTPEPATTGDGTDELEKIGKAARYLAAIPAAVEGDGGDAQTYRAACAMVNDFNLSESAAWPLLAEWNKRCSPPWSDSELRSKLHNASQYGKHEPGCKAPPPTDSLPDDPAPEWFSIAGIGNEPNYGSGLQPITTGFGTLDNALRGGFRPESLYVIAGRTGSSKSTAAANILRKVALDGISTLCFKLEESPTELVYRIHAAAARVDFRRFLDGASGATTERPALVDAWNLIRGLPIRISDCRNIDGIRRLSRKHVETGGELIIIDQLSQVAVPDALPGYQQAAEVSATLRQLACELHVPVVTIVQVNRMASRGKEHLTCNDLRDSGTIENDAAGVIMINAIRKPEAPTWSTDELVRYLDLLIVKNRYGPTTDPAKPLELTWWPRHCRIEDPAPMGATS